MKNEYIFFITFKMNQIKRVLRQTGVSDNTTITTNQFIELLNGLKSECENMLYAEHSGICSATTLDADLRNPNQWIDIIRIVTKDGYRNLHIYYDPYVSSWVIDIIYDETPIMKVSNARDIIMFINAVARSNSNLPIIANHTWYAPGIALIYDKDLIILDTKIHGKNTYIISRRSSIGLNIGIFRDRFECFTHSRYLFLNRLQ